MKHINDMTLKEFDAYCASLMIAAAPQYVKYHFEGKSQVLSENQRNNIQMFEECKHDVNAIL